MRLSPAQLILLASVSYGIVADGLVHAGITVTKSFIMQHGPRPMG